MVIYTQRFIQCASVEIYIHGLREPHQQSTFFYALGTHCYLPTCNPLELFENAIPQTSSAPVPRLAWPGRFIVAKIPELYRLGDRSIMGEWEVPLDCLVSHDLVRSCWGNFFVVA